MKDTSHAKLFMIFINGYFAPLTGLLVTQDKKKKVLKTQKRDSEQTNPDVQPFSFLLSFPCTMERSRKPHTFTQSILLQRQASAAEHHNWKTFLLQLSALLSFLWSNGSPRVRFYKLRWTQCSVRGQSSAVSNLHKKEALVFNWIRNLSLTFEKHAWRHFDLMWFAY